MKHVLLAAALPLMMWAAPAFAETVNCTNITALPATITVPGVYCLKQDLATSITSGAAITINANSVTIDFNGYKLGGLGAGPATQAYGVFADNRKNITLRNGNVRGFQVGMFLSESSSEASSGHVIEDNLLEANTVVGIRAAGSGIAIRRNRIVNTDSTPPSAPSSQPAAVFGLEVPIAAAMSFSSRSRSTSNTPAPQAGTGDSVNGIFGLLRNSKIVDNFVVATISSASEAYGIVVAESSNVEIARNTVLDTRGNSFAIGIAFQTSETPATTFSENVVIGVTSATESGFGIWNLGGTLLCRDNTVASVTTSQTFGCNSESGTFPPTGP